MWTYLIGYTVIALVVLFVVFVELVSHRVIFKNSPKVFGLFANPLLTYSIRRIGSAIISILLALAATYMLIRFKVDKGGDEICKAAISTWDKLSETQRILRCAALKEKLGVSGNWLGQILAYFFKILPFPKTICQTSYEDVTNVFLVTNTNCRTVIMDLGTVYFLTGASQGQYVMDVIIKKMGVSFKVTILATVIELVLGYPFGMIMAKNKDGVFDKIGKAYIISIDAIPGVAYYYIWLSLFFAIGLNTTVTVSDPKTYIAPALTMGLTGMAGIGLWVRRYMLDEFNSDYVKFARSKGLSENRILATHVLRNAIVPLVRSIPSAVLGALLGSFYIEKIYGYADDGFGGLLLQAQDKNDFYVLQGIIVVTALISVLSYLLGDIVTAMVDPRVSFSTND